MLDTENLVISAINTSLGESPDAKSYDVSALQSRIKQTTSRAIIPPLPDREFLDFLEWGSDASRFLRKCIESENSMGFITYNAVLLTEWPDHDIISPTAIASNWIMGAYAALAAYTLQGLDITFEEFRTMHKTATVWHHKKLAIYVAEVWNSIQKDADSIKSTILREIENHKYFIPPWTSVQQEVSFVASITAIVIWKYIENMTVTMSQDPEFKLWITLDSLLNPSRPQTAEYWRSDNRLMKIISVGLYAGMDTASGYLQVALDKSNSDRALALSVYRNSFRDLFWVIGMMDHNFIAGFSVLVRKPKAVMKMAEYMRIGEIEDMLHAFQNIENSFHMDEKFHTPVMHRWRDDKLIRVIMQSDRTGPYSSEFFDMTPEGTLRIKQWMIDFVRLVNAHLLEGATEKMYARGCPMMHSKKPKEEWGMIFMQDFSDTFANIVEEFWKNNTAL